MAEDGNQTINLRISPDSGPVEFHQRSEPQTGGGLPSWLKDLGTVATAVAGVFISIFVYQLNSRQAATAESSLRASAINQLGTAPDGSNQQELAAIALADFGRDALPAVKMFLRSLNPEVRRSGVVALARMYIGETTPHKTLLSLLRESFGSPDVSLRLGVLEAYAELMPSLTQTEADDVLKSISKLVDSGGNKPLANSSLLKATCRLLGVTPGAAAPGLILKGIQETDDIDLKREGWEALRLTAGPLD